MTTLLAGTKPQIANIGDALETLAKALRGRGDITRNVEASATSPSPAEGLALMSSYLRIEDGAIRQALLDTIAALAAR